MIRNKGRFTGLARVTRGAVLGSAVVLITIAGHFAGFDAGMPSPDAFVILLPLAVALGSALADRRLRSGTLVAYVVGVQVLMHVVLTMGFSHSAGTGHGTTLIPGPRMILGHVLATVLVLIALAYGEDLLHRWLRFIADRRHTWVLTFSPLLEGATPSWARTVEPLLAVEFAALVRRRGPPLPL